MGLQNFIVELSTVACHWMATLHSHLPVIVFMH